MGAFTLNAEGITREEVRYQKFIKRLRSAYSELVVKPWFLQMCLDFPALKDDFKFSNAIGIKYHNDNVFEEMKEKELEAKRIASFTAKKGIMKDDGTPFFSTDYLVRNELRMTESEIDANEEWFEMREKEVQAATGDMGAGGGGGDLGGGGGAAAGGGGGEAPAGGGGETVDGGETGAEGSL